MKFTSVSMAACAVLACGLAAAQVPQVLQVPQEAALRKALAERHASFAKIDEISKTPIAGLYEIRIGKRVLYSDADGAHVIDGQLIDLKAKRNLTEERVAKLSTIDFASLPLKDAVVWKTGTGARRIAVFADPNCGYCKRFEKELAGVKDLTVYTFLVPILGGDSPDKADAIWCAKDATAAYRGWMLDGTPPPRLLGECKSSPLQRNVALIQKHEIAGTPAIVFEDGVRVPGMLNAAQLEKQLATSSGKS